MMSDKLCTKCGAPLLEGSAFCTKCGTPVNQEDGPQGSDAIQDSSAPSNEHASDQASPEQSTTNPFLQSSSSTRTTQGLSQSASAQKAANPFVQPASAQQTTQGLNRTVSVQSTTNPNVQSTPVTFGSIPGQGTPTQTGIASNNKRLIIILAAIAVVGLAIILFSVTRCAAPNNTNVVGTAAPGAASSASTSSSSSASAAATANLSPEKQNAVSIYEQMAALDARISACATEFNENYMKSDRALRERYANTAYEVLSDAASLQTTISAMSTSGVRELGDDTGHLRELANDLFNRIHVIDEAWERSLEFSNPSAHESYIIAPIVADNEGGTNKYYRHFKDNYANWNPLNS